MTARAPLVLGPNGKPQQLQSGDTLAGSGGGGSATAVRASVDFGLSFADKASVTLTGLAWVAADSNISASVLTPAGADPDEIRLLEFLPVISGLVPGTGFTLTVYSTPEARGTYEFMCVAA